MEPPNKRQQTPTIRSDLDGTPKITEATEQLLVMENKRPMLMLGILGAFSLFFWMACLDIPPVPNNVPREDPGSVESSRKLSQKERIIFGVIALFTSGFSVAVMIQNPDRWEIDRKRRILTVYTFEILNSNPQKECHSLDNLDSIEAVLWSDPEAFSDFSGHTIILRFKNSDGSTYDIFLGNTLDDNLSAKKDLVAKIQKFIQ
ncbi:MAG: hypothetical protein ACRCU2_14900 [Planktothrix sp.]